MVEQEQNDYAISLPFCTMANPLPLWAKSPAKGQSDGYPLLPHLLDVAAVASELQQTIPSPVPLPCSPEWVSALVGFHDLGKATPGFQKKLGRDSIPNYPFLTGAPDRHDASTVPLLTTQLVQQGVSRCDAWLLASAVGAHHGHLIDSTEQQKAGRSAKHLDTAWHEAHKHLFTQLLEGIGADGYPTLSLEKPQQAVFLQWLMGLTTVSDWIGSSEALCRWDRLECWENDPAKWFTASRRLAVKALSDVGLEAAALRTVDCGDDAIGLALDGMKPRPLQQNMAKILDQLGQEPGLVVIEAPMGEGKTEAGFGCAVGRRGLYVAMPTQATSNALMGRTARFLERATDQPTKLALAHGAGGPAVAANRLQEVDPGTTDSTVTAGWWFRGSKRSLLCPQGIGTVDQALIGVLNARHGFVRLFGLAGRTVILDEVHAYDAYTGGLIERLISWLQQLGCRVVLMSATLPAARRDAILQAWAGRVPVPSNPYPRISWASHGSVKSLSFPASRHQSLSVQGIDPDAVTARAVKMAQDGARVLLVVNKVARAQAVYQEITGVERTLFHARFPMNERTDIEKRVLKLFGPRGTAQTGHVLVATQVAEQSLDIDMDVLITDPAPVDLVLQRAGRIHRHDRQRPDGFKEPLVLVAGLDQEMPPDNLTSYIYDRWLVLRSHAWLRTRPLLNLPTDIDLAVQQIYGDWKPPAPGPELEKELAHAFPKHEADQKRMTQQSHQAVLPEPCDWSTHPATRPIDDDAAESGALEFGTRLGQPSLTVIPLSPADCESLVERAPELAGRWLRISHQRLILAIRDSQPPARWSTCSGLSHHKALLLDADGVFQSRDGELMAHLDSELGLVIH